jgi:hypothetical protein
MKCNIKIVSLIIILLLNYSFQLSSQLGKNIFRDDKEKIEKNINSMILGNFLRKVMLQVKEDFLIMLNRITILLVDFSLLIIMI